MRESNRGRALSAPLFALATLVIVQAMAPSLHAQTPAKKPAGTAPAHFSPARKAPARAGHTAGSQELDRIAAVVNDDVVLQSDVDEQVMLFLQRSNARPDSEVVDTLRRQILDQMINEKVIVAEAKRMGMSVSPPEVNRQVDQAIADAHQRMGSEEAFRQQLARENLSEDKLRDKYRGEIERQMLAQRLVQRQLPAKEVPPAEAEAYFKEHGDKFPKAPAQVRLSVIQIPVRPDSLAELKGHDAALAARKRIVGGEKFAKVASEVSEDPGSAKAGGDLGFFSKGTMEIAFDNVAFTIPLNTVSEPVRTPFGWHLIEVLDRDTVKTVAHVDSVGADGKPVLEAHARHVLIRLALNDGDAERARKLAERVRAEAVKGTDFGALVRRYSKYEGQQTPDGDIGFVAVTTLQDHIRAGIDSLETGQVSQPLANPVGYNIFKLADRKAERVYTLDEIRKELPQAVAEIKQRERYDAWVKTLRAKAHIEIRR